LYIPQLPFTVPSTIRKFVSLLAKLLILSICYFLNAFINRAYGDWTRRQSAIDTPQQYLLQQQQQLVAAHASQREQILESALRTTRWPTKHNVAEATDDLATHPQYHTPLLTAFRTLEQKPSTAVSEQTEKAALQVRRKFLLN
jgi:hypothetical protein